MTGFAYSLVSESNVDGDMYWVRAAADEIHRYAVSAEPVAIIPGREQRVTVSRSCKAMLRYPLEGTPTRVFYIEDGIGGDEETLDADDDYEILPSGRILRFDSEHVGKEVHVVGDSGWGRELGLGAVAALDASQTDVEITLSAYRRGGLPDDPAGMVLRVDDELMLVTVQSASAIVTDSDDEGTDATDDDLLSGSVTWIVERGAGGTTAGAHDASSAVSWVRPDAKLEAAARGIASALKVRDSEPGRGVSRAVQVPDGHRLVRTDPLYAFRRDLDEYRW